MRVRIHRGTEEIGGTCIEIEAQGKRIVLDVGLPLDAPDDDQPKLLPNVDGFLEPDDTLLGVFISHPHKDHYGLAHHLGTDVKVHIGEDANRILTAARTFIEGAHAFSNPHFLKHRKPIDIGPFRVTPYLVDHSAFDSYSLLVEAEGKRIFYSGDFRAHGRKSSLFKSIVSNPPKNIDVLLMEGTTIGRQGSSKGFASEDDLEERFVQEFRDHTGLQLVWVSSQNIDRIVTVFRATKRTNRVLLIDLYTAVVLEATGRDTIPQSHWENVMLFVPFSQRRFIKQRELFKDLERHSKNRIFGEDLPNIRERTVMLFRPMLIQDRDVKHILKGARLTHSMWPGYLSGENSQRVIRLLEEYGVSTQTIHTSGHAAIKDLQLFARAIAPKKLVPIHSFETGRFHEFFDNVIQKEDGLWWEV